MSIAWCVAHTQSLKEFVANQHLLAQGYEVYLARFRKICRHACKVEEKLVPLFTRYIFLGLDLNIISWRKVNGTRGISHLLMADHMKPARVTMEILNALRSQETQEGIVPLWSLNTFIKGDKVRIVKEVFKDQVAIFESLDDKSRIKLLLAFMGREIKIALPNQAVIVA